MTGLIGEQRDVFDKLLRNRGGNQVQTLGGLAGTGKTTIVVALAEALPGHAPCSFTGKAAAVLRARGIEASTIHSLIYTPARQNDGTIEFVLKNRVELGCDGFLVDEASMVSQDLHRDLLSFGLPIIAAGDHGQLPPVGTDVNLMANPDHRLERIHRNAGPIAHFAQHLRKGRPADRFDGGDKVQIVSPLHLTDGMVLAAGQVICAYNRTRVGVNRTIRRLKGRRQPVENGDRLICLRNHRRAGLFNGQQGRVRKVQPGHRVDFRSGGVTYPDLPYDPDALGQEKPELNHDPLAPHPFDYAWAVTCHKAQGSEWNRVIVIEPPPCKVWEHARWTYTAASRARRSLIWVLSAKTREGDGRCEPR